MRRLLAIVGLVLLATPAVAAEPLAIAELLERGWRIEAREEKLELRPGEGAYADLDRRVLVTRYRLVRDGVVRICTSAYDSQQERIAVDCNHTG